jgi:hypothetical protein
MLQALFESANKNQFETCEQLFFQRDSRLVQSDGWRQHWAFSPQFVLRLLLLQQSG